DSGCRVADACALDGPCVVQSVADRVARERGFHITFLVCRVTRSRVRTFAGDRKAASARCRAASPPAPCCRPRPAWLAQPRVSRASLDRSRATVTPPAWLAGGGVRYQ